MRLITSLAFASILFASSTPVTPALAGGVTDCSRTEQSGCFEIDILNFKSTAQLYQLAVNGQGQRMYNMYKGGGASGAANNCWHIYVWNDENSVPTSHMAEYHIIGRNGANPYRTEVTEVSTQSGPAGYTEYSSGPPDRAFKLCTNAAVAAIQFPWQMFGPDSLVLLCSEDNNLAYPNPDAYEGQWFTSGALMRAKAERSTYEFAPFLFL